jgi:ribosome biogenesis GTPase
MPDGIIIKGIGGFYYVKCGDEIIETKVRGIFRNVNIIPMVGDKVEIDLQNDREGVITKIYERKNELTRPPVTNADQLIIVAAVISPKPNILLIDKLLIACEQNNLDAVVCLNKIDLAVEDEYKWIIDLYELAGYKVIMTSSHLKVGIDNLRQELKNKVSIFAGASGVGKSSLLNSINENFRLETGEVSKKIRRGRHVTRHVELLEFDKEAYVADTPGFTAIDLSDIKAEKLSSLYKEFRKYKDFCCFNDCSHTTEPGCAVIEAVKNKEISVCRHENYKEIYNQLNSIKEW